MARSYAAIHLRIWADPEWRTLDGDAQHLYLLLLSQPSLNLAGVLPLQTRRWASCVADWDAPAVDMALSRLAEARFVVVDQDTEEVLIRSFIRNDGNYRIPNVLKSLCQIAEGTQAPALRAELAIELGRLDALEGKKADEGRALIAATRLVLGASNGPSGPSGEPMPEPLAEPLADGFVATHGPRVVSSATEPMPEPSGSGSGSGTSLSPVKILGGENFPRPPRCARHDDLPIGDEPPCRACQRMRENWEATQAEAAKPPPKPTWCGACDEHTRLTEDLDGSARRCRVCHPLQAVAS